MISGTTQQQRHMHIVWERLSQSLHFNESPMMSFSSLSLVSVSDVGVDHVIVIHLIKEAAEDPNEHGPVSVVAQSYGRTANLPAPPSAVAVWAAPAVVSRMLQCSHLACPG